MNRIGIIFAMRKELDEFLKLVEFKDENRIYDLVFYSCVINDKKLFLVESGVGKVNAARCTQVLIDNMNVDAVINIGVAGSISEGINVGDIVIGEKLVQHDFDVTPFDHEKGYIPNVGIYVNSDKKLLSLCKKVKTDVKIHKGVIASGDIFCNDKKMGLKINSKFNALCVEMEGASIAQVCYLCNKPFVVIRSISDSLIENVDNKITYKEFVIESSKVVAKYLKDLILSIKK